MNTMRARCVIFLLSALTGTSVINAQETPPDTTTPEPAPPNAEVLDVTALVESLRDVDFWIVLSVTVVIGAIGGFVYELIALQGMIERGHRPTKDESKDLPHAIHRFVYDLGYGGRMIIGGMAAVVALWVIKPNDTFAWLAICLLAGSAGTAIFQTMKDRLLAVIAERKVQELEADNHRISALVPKAIEAGKNDDQNEMIRIETEARVLATPRSSR